MLAPSRRNSNKSIRVNFAGVEEEIRKHAQRAALLPDGDYLVKILDASMRENEDTGARGVNVRVQVIKPNAHKSKVQYGYCSMKKEALWNLRNLINAALGRNVAGKIVDLDLTKFEGKIVGAVIEQDEYQGKVRSRVSTWFPETEFEDSGGDEEEEEEEEEEYEDEEEEEEEAPRQSSRRSRRSAPAEEEEEEDLESVEVEDL